MIFYSDYKYDNEFQHKGNCQHQIKRYQLKDQNFNENMLLGNPLSSKEFTKWMNLLSREGTNNAVEYQPEI